MNMDGKVASLTHFVLPRILARKTQAGLAHPTFQNWVYFPGSWARKLSLICDVKNKNLFIFP